MIFQTQGNHGFDRPLVDRHHLFGGFLIGIGNFFPCVVIIGNGNGIRTGGWGFCRGRNRGFCGSGRAGGKCSRSQSQGCTAEGILCFHTNLFLV